MWRWITAALLTVWLSFFAAAQASPANSAAATPIESMQSAPATSPVAQSASPLDRFKEFSALMTGGVAPGTEAEIHIYRSGNLMRMEANEGRSFQISDLVKQETHGVAKRGCLHYKNAYLRTFPFVLTGAEYKFEITPVKKETVDGHECQVEDLTVSSPKLHNPVQLRLWEAEDLRGFPVKVETATHRIIQYTNVVLGPQDPTLFIFPDECEGAEQIGKRPSPSSPAKKAPKP
jgi:hypothetical protein